MQSSPRQAYVGMKLKNVSKRPCCQSAQHNSNEHHHCQGQSLLSSFGVLSKITIHQELRIVYHLSLANSRNYYTWQIYILARKGRNGKYVNPIHRQLQLHNVFTVEKFIETDIKKMDIQRLQALIRVSDNMHDEELHQVRKAHCEEKRNAHKTMI